MTSRERVLAALAHRAPDRVPLDLGGTHRHRHDRECAPASAAHLAMEDAGAARIFSRRSSTVIPDEPILERFHTDCRAVLLGDPISVPIVNSPMVACWMNGESPGSDPAGGTISGSRPVLELRRSGTVGCGWASLARSRRSGRYRGLRERARILHETTPYAVIFNLGVGPVHLSQYLRGYGEWLMDLVERPAFAEALLELTAEFQARSSRARSKKPRPISTWSASATISHAASPAARPRSVSPRD